MGKSTVNDQSPYPKLRRPATADHLRGKPKPWRILEVRHDADAMRQVRDAKTALIMAQSAIDSSVGAEERTKRLAPLQAEVDHWQAQVDETTYQFIVAGLGRVAKERLLAEHKPRDKDHERAKAEGQERAEFNLDTYPNALIAASLVEPKLTADEVEEITAEWTDGECLLLWNAVQEVNVTSSLVGLGNALSGTNGSTRN